MIHKIYTYDDPILRVKTDDWPMPSTQQVSEEYSFMIKLHNDKIIQHMWDTLHNTQGAGLAMPQIGLPGRLIVIEEELSPGELFKGVFFNAHIHNYSGIAEIVYEGCLSFPGIKLPILRPYTIDIEWYDENWIYHREFFDGIKSRILQHEVDHLDGILMIDRAHPDEVAKLSIDLDNIKNKKVKINYPINEK